MSTYYCYVNWDLEEYFGVGVGGYSGRLAAAGYTPAARALGLLLADAGPGGGGGRRRRGESIIGRWYRSRVSLEPDDYGAWATSNDHFVDVSADVIVMLCLHNDDDAIASLCAHEPFYLQVAHLLVTWQMPSHVRHRLEQMLGDDYRSRYATLAKEQPYALHSVQLPQTLRWFEDG